MRRPKALGAVLVLLTLVVGIPIGLADTIGNPLHGWADLRNGDLSDAVIIDLLAAIVWLAWAQFAASVLVEAVAAAGHIRVPTHLPFVPGASQRLAHVLVGAALLVGTAAPLAAPLHAFAVASVHPSAAAAQAESRGRDMDTQSTPGAPSLGKKALHTVTQAQQTFYVIPQDGRGPDTYWDIAAERLGGGEHWHQVWDLNRGRVQPDGEVMTNPGLLRPGWTVLLPASATSPSDDETPVAEVTVRAGDTLSSIAASHGMNDWHGVWATSKGMAEPEGRRLIDPDLILPGWIVQVPIAGSSPVPANPSPTPQSQPPTQQIPAPQQAPGQSEPGGRTPQEQRPIPGSSVPVTPQGSPVASPNLQSDQSSAQLSMVAFAGGGVLLAGMMLGALVRHRRRQFRWRRPGRAIAATPPELHRVEQALLATGPTGLADVNWLNEALRTLVHRLAETDAGQLPEVIAVRMTADTLELVLADERHDAPSPWIADDAGTRWSIGRTDDLGYDPSQRAYHFAPFPALASVGYTETGEHWLLDLERVGSLSLLGDRERCLGLARFIAAELAHNEWSEMLQVTLVGFGEEMAEINPERVSYTEDVGKAIAVLNSDLSSTSDAIRNFDVDLLTGRLRNIAEDAWAPHVMLIAPSAADDTDGLEYLLSAIRGQASRTAVALVLVDHAVCAEDTRWQLNVDEHGTLRIPTLGLELIAQQIPIGESAQLAQMLAFAATTNDRPMPDADGNQPWDEYSDAAGNLRASLPVAVAGPELLINGSGSGIADIPGPRTPPDVAASDRAGSYGDPDRPLPLPAQAYLERAATTSGELDVLFPTVDERLRQAVLRLDPSLDEDLAAWYNPDCSQPKVTLLGPVTVVAQGPLPVRNPRLLWNTEIVAYLATRSSGVSLERYANDMWPGNVDIAAKTNARQSISVVRQWLGVNQRTGRPHLPKGLTAGLASPYRLEDVLVDAELFRRLRIRATARGADGIPDLRTALDLVTGVPFSDRRPQGYGWLTENPLDHVYAAMIVDVAHIVATHHLAANEPELAVSAALVALRAGTSEDVLLLDLVAACDAQDHRAEAEAYIKRILANHDAEVEEDLPPRTADILHQRQWLG
ncbi:MAG: putative LysM domain peptidoglycan-binding protein [Pseudonocardiales bacterium]|nr:putative LysM domain peptidoglycan-binding protein [Pseudonocardiales bacterium]